MMLKIMHIIMMLSLGGFIIIVFNDIISDTIDDMERAEEYNLICEDENKDLISKGELICLYECGCDNYLYSYGNVFKNSKCQCIDLKVFEK